MRRRRINMTKEGLPKWFVRMRRKYIKRVEKDYSHCINNEFD